MNWVDVLVLFERASNAALLAWEQGKEWLREYLGPSSQTVYLLFENAEVIPASRGHSKYAHGAEYRPLEHRIVATESTDPFKRLPWLSIQHCMGDHVVDLSDWISDLRTNTTVSLLTLLRLASQVQNIHLPEHSHAKINVILRSGEEEEYVYRGSTILIQRIAPMPVDTAEMQRRITCPFDTTDGPMFF